MHGASICLVLIPKKLPIKIKGNVQNTHKTNNEIISDIFTAAEDFSIERIILTNKYPNNNVPGKITDVNNALKSQYFPLKNWYILVDVYPPGRPIIQKKIIPIFNKFALFSGFEKPKDPRHKVKMSIYNN